MLLFKTFLLEYKLDRVGLTINEIWFMETNVDKNTDPTKHSVTVIVP